MIYTNTASRAELIKNEIDSWLNLTLSFEGDTIMINRDMESEVKLLSATTFTADTLNPHNLIKNNKFNLRVLIATLSCIRADLDLSSVHSIIQVGFPISIFDMIQEIGRYERSRNNDGTNLTDEFFCFYLYKTLFI